MDVKLFVLIWIRGLQTGNPLPITIMNYIYAGYKLNE